MGQIEDLRLFALVVENRSISKAADKLHIAKSAVSRRLNLLEQRVGARLIDRAPGRWEVTAIGQELYQRAVRVVGEMDEIEHDFTDTAQNLTGPLTVSVPREFGLAHLKPALIAFQERFREIQLTVDFDDRLVDLARENYDCAIRVTASPGGNIVAEAIGTTRHQLCASPAYLARQGRPRCLDDLRDHCLLNFGSARRTTWHFVSAHGRAEKIEFQPAMNSNSGAFLLDAAVRGLGLARLPDFIARPALEAGGLVTVLPEMTMPDWGIFLVYPESRRLNRRMRLFSEAMRAACASDQG